MRVISHKALASEKGITHSRQWIAKLVKAGLFPQPIKIGLRNNGYIESEIDAMMEAKAQARKAA